MRYGPGPRQNTCFCDGVPCTLQIPLPKPKNKGSTKQKKKTEGKSFQVCKKCNFFGWVNETPRKDPGYHPDPINPILELMEGDDKRKHTCESHFLIKQHVTDETFRAKWWKQHYGHLAGKQGESNKKSEASSLLVRLMTTSAMAFTSLPRLLSQRTSRCHLILMRWYSCTKHMLGA